MMYSESAFKKNHSPVVIGIYLKIPSQSSCPMSKIILKFSLNEY